jgi:hypothetical protein
MSILLTPGVIASRRGWVDPLAGITFALRLQTHRGDGVPYGLYQDTACTIRATADGHSVAAWRDEISGSGLVAIQGTSTKRPTLRFSGGIPWLDFDGVDDALYVVGDWDETLSSSTGVQRQSFRPSTWDPVVAVGNAETGPFILLAPRHPEYPDVTAIIGNGHPGTHGVTRKNGSTSALSTTAGEWMAASVQGIQTPIPAGWNLVIGNMDVYGPGNSIMPSDIGVTSVIIQAGNVSVAAVDAYVQILNPS